jgi:hypothetical protein
MAGTTHSMKKHDIHHRPEPPASGKFIFAVERLYSCQLAGL